MSAAPALKLVDLNETEMMETNGGDGGFTLLGAALVVGGAVAAGVIIGGVAAYIVYRNCVNET
ncbi:MAG TPA: hypothetical protein VF615_05915 [Longimicrobiaceae bacterium]|jgi:hypothetical protein